MKKVILMALAGLLCGAMAVASGVASAQTLPSFNAVTTGGTPVAITTHRMASFECTGGQVNTTRVDSDTKYYIDTSGALCTKLKSVSGFASKWVKQPGVERYFQVIFDSSQCYAGNTMLNYNYGLQISDGCAVDADIKNRSQ